MASGRDPAVQAAGIGLKDCWKSSPEDFEVQYSLVHDYILFECRDDQGDPQGLAVGQILKRFRADEDGAFLQIRYIQCSDPFYRHWVEAQDASTYHHHLCQHSYKSCQRKVGKDAVVHIQRWAPISKREMEAVLKEWKLKPMVVGPGTYKGQELREVATAAKKKAVKLPPRKEEMTYGLESEDFDESLESIQGAPKTPEKEKTKHGRSADEKKKDREVERSRRSRTPELRTRGRGLPKDPMGRRGVLDAMLEDETAADELEQDNEAKLDALRERLGEAKKKRESSGKASAVLAARVSEGAKAEELRRKKKRNQGDEMGKVLKILTKGRSSKKRSASSRSSSGGSSDEGMAGASSGSKDLASKQRRLRKIAADRPGTLLTRGYSLMHDSLGTMYGVPDASMQEPAEILKPAALRYLLTCAFPLMDLKALGEDRIRELRTLATSLDLIVAGRPTSAADYMVQRFKAILMAVRDGSDVAAKFLELLPPEVYPTGATDEETGYARAVAYRHAKNEDLLRKMAG